MSINISVITPMYNSEQYLGQCIESFLEQSIVQQSELILVDDCSPDHSIEIANDYARRFPQNIRVIGYEKNRRAGGARNFGLRNAKGKWVLFLDADDWLDRYALEKLYNIAENGTFDIVDCDYYSVDNNQDNCMEYHTSMFDEAIGFQDIKKKSINIIRGGRIFTKLFLRKYLIENNLIYPENIKFEDNGIGAIICYKAANIGKVNEALYFYRTNNMSSQTGQIQSWDSVQDRLKAGRYMLETAKRIGAYGECYDAVAYRYIELFYASNLSIYVHGKFKLPLNVFRDMRREIWSSFPDYRKTQYYEKLPRFYRMCCGINDFSPMALALFKLVFIVYRRVKK